MSESSTGGNVGCYDWSVPALEREFNERLGARIRDARRGRRMTQDELAAIIGVPRTSLVAVEHARQRLTAYQLVVAADALGVPIAELVDPAPAPSGNAGLPTSAPESVRRFVATVQSAARAKRRSG
jgi:transcriptional regulator with XRE-family HTH domain